MSEDHVIWELPATTIQKMVMYGFAQKAEDGVHEFTPEGVKWISEWCAEGLKKFTPEQIAAAKERLDQAKEKS